MMVVPVTQVAAEHSWGNSTQRVVAPAQQQLRFLQEVITSSSSTSSITFTLTRESAADSG